VNTLRLEPQGPIAILRLDKPRANAIDEALLDDLEHSCRTLTKDDGFRGVLLASSHPKIFCPGLDLVTLVEYDRPALKRFMLRFAQAVWTLYSLPKPVVAAVSGHAVAGGCILALTADHRVLCRGAQIGLNEVRLGVPLPWSVAVLLRASVTPAAFARVALLGNNFSGEEAVATGLVHELADADGFEAACLARLDEFAARDSRALARTKAYLRAEALREMRAHEEELLSEFLDGWFSEATRARIRETVLALQKPR
jgi:enoyl-CoA hydratase